MRRIKFNVLRFLAMFCKIFSHKLYMSMMVAAYRANGAQITGMPAYIDFSAYIDTSGGLTINEGVGISVGAIILTHDWSFLRRYKARNLPPPPSAFVGSASIQTSEYR